MIGLGSNLLVRDGGVPGVVIRLGRGFAQSAVEPEHRLRAGAAVPDVKLARAAADAGIAGLAFYRGVPGSIGGALRMNAGAHGRETRDVLVEARAVDRQGRSHVLAPADMAFSYRHCGVPEDWIFTEALYQGSPGDLGRDPKSDGRGCRLSRSQSADQPAHRWFHIQEPAGIERLAADRSGRLSGLT